MFNYNPPKKVYLQEQLLTMIRAQFEQCEEQYPQNNSSAKKNSKSNSPEQEEFLRYYWNFEVWLSKPVSSIVEKALDCLCAYIEKKKKFPCYGYAALVVDGIIKLACAPRAKTL